MVGILKKWNFGLWRFTVPVALVLALGFTLLPMATPVQAATFTAAATGNWNVGATWGNTGNNVEGSGYPGPSDTANIPIGYPLTITIPSGVTARATTVNLNSASADGTANLTLADATSSLIVSGNIIMNAPSTTLGNRGCTLTMNGGTVTVGGNLSLSSYFKSGGSKVFQSIVDFTGGGTVSVAGTITLTSNSASAPSLIDMTAGGNLNLAAATPVSITNSTFTPGTGTVGYNGTTQTVSNAITYNNLTISGSGTKTLGGNLTIGGNLTVSAGTLDLSSYTANRTAGGGTLTVSNGATLSIGGTNTMPTNYTTHTFGATSTINYSGTNQTVASETYAGHLTLSGSGTKTLQTGTTTIGGNLTLSGTAATTTVVGLAIGGNLSVGNGTTFTAAGYALTVTGTTTIGSGTSGNLTINNSAGAKIFTGLVTVSANGTWNNSGNSAITFRGGVTNNGTFTAGSGVQTFDTNVQALTGTFSIPSVTVTGVTLTNNGTLTVTTALAGTGGLTNAATGTLNIGGTSTITTLTATASGNTVNYNGTGAQTAANVNYYNLTFSSARGANSITINGAVGVAGTLTNSATFAGGNFVLTGSTFTFNGTGSQTVISLNSVAYPALTINNASGVNLGGSVAITNTLTLTSGALSIGANTLTLNGVISQTSGTLTGGSSSNITFGGSGASTALPTISLNNLIINRANGISLGGDVTVGGTLTFTSGNITTSSNKVIIASGGTVSRTSGHVVGNLQKAINTNGSVSRTFEVGTGSDYTPIDVAISGVSGSGSSGQTLTGTTTSGEHPNISTSYIASAKDVNRYWTLTYGGSWTFTSYNAALTFVNTDKDGGTDTTRFVVRKYASSAWTIPPGGVTTASNTTTGNGFTSFSDYAVGEPPWQSFRESGHTTVWGTVSFPYDSTYGTAYMYGDGYITGHSYSAGFYDGNGSKIATDSSGPIGGTTFSAQFVLNTNPNAVVGTWHAVVFDSDLGSPPATYAASYGAAGYATEDSFEVGASAIPEFPTVFASIGVMGLCAVIYYRMRKKSKLKRQTA